jgi:hypothetical protein
VPQFPTDQTLTPGAVTSTSGPVLENQARPIVWSMAATTMALSPLSRHVCATHDGAQSP